MKNFQHLAGVVLVLALSAVLFFSFTTEAEAATVASGTCGANGANLTWTLDDAGTLTISGTGSMKNYSYYSGAPWYAKRTSIKSVVIGNGVTSIGERVFYQCTSLTSITIPDSVTSIGSRAFYECTSLTSITIGNGVTSIGNYAFEDCDSLTGITIPDSVTSIGNWAFYECDSLTGIWVDENNIAYTNDAKGVLFNKEMTTLIQAPGALNGSYTIPNSVTSIGGSAFEYCRSLTSVTIGNSVTSIGEYAFYCCIILTSITIPDSVTSIGYAAFYRCTSLTNITIPDSVTSIGDYAFAYCYSLTSITIPDSVTSIGNFAFEYCDSLKTVYYSGSQSRWKQISIGDDNDDLTSANIQYNHIHDYTLPPVTTVEPTCTEAGYREYTCVFGETYRESIPALGHDYSGTVAVIAPTCTATGHTNTQCIRCDSVQKSDVTDPIGHKMAVVAAVAPTCTQTGLTVGAACERCGMVGVAQKEVAATGHNMVNGVCTVCGFGVPGDLNGDEETNADDAITLLLHVSMPAMFPVEGDADFNGDGEVDTDDAVRLILHISLPNHFPLYTGKKED